MAGSNSFFSLFASGLEILSLSLAFRYLCGSIYLSLSSPFSFAHTHTDTQGKQKPRPYLREGFTPKITKQKTHESFLAALYVCM